jgi:hypothetical protein
VLDNMLRVLMPCIQKQSLQRKDLRARKTALFREVPQGYDSVLLGATTTGCYTSCTVLTKALARTLC